MRADSQTTSCSYIILYKIVIKNRERFYTHLFFFFFLQPHASIRWYEAKRFPKKYIVEIVILK